MSKSALNNFLKLALFHKRLKILNMYESVFITTLQETQNICF